MLRCHIPAILRPDHTQKKGRSKIGNLFRESSDALTVPPACCPTWSRAPSPLFIPSSPFSHSLIPINLISPVPSPSLRSHFQSYLSNPPTSIFLPSPAFHLASLTPTPPQGLPKAWAFRYEIQCPTRKPKSQESFSSYTMD